MDRKYPLETQLLARSFDPQRVVELLQQRYAPNDKPLLSLRPTDREDKKFNRSIEGVIRDKKAFKIQRRNDVTKLVFKKFVKRSIRSHKALKSKASRLEKHGQHPVDITKLKEYAKVPRLDQFLQLNSLWIGYIQDLIGVEFDKMAMQNVLTKLSSADFNGCFLNVLKSRNKQLLNCSGIVVWDSKNFFIIVQELGLKMVEKKGSVFNFVVPLYDYKTQEIDDNDDNYLEFSIIGSRFQYRSSDRAGRKFKARSVDDLEL